MENGYDIFWTSHALNELAETFSYLENNFPPLVSKELAQSLDRVLKRIAIQPATFSLSDFIGIRKVVVKKFNTLYYRQKGDRIEIISFFSNRQNPGNLKNILETNP